MTFEVGQIFEGEYPPEAACWCNERGDCFIEEIEPAEDGQRRFLIVGVPEPTPEELAERARMERDALIGETDFLMMPDYPLTDEERAAVADYRQALRDLPASDGFPEAITWPVAPAILAAKGVRHHA